MDYSARLKNRHLVDLIAYMKTSKKSIKPTDEEMNDGEQAEKDYMNQPEVEYKKIQEESEEN